MFVTGFILIFIFMRGVDADEVKSVSVMEGESVTLHADVTEILTDDHIMWRFGPNNSRIAESYKHTIPRYDNGSFIDRLKLDSQTGSLTISNISITDAGDYKRTLINSSGTSDKTFIVSVYARLPVPVISINATNCSSSSERCCVLLCSVMNVTHVSLSWYKGNSLLSSISVSDLNIRLSLHLEVEYQDTNTYTCVINNHITSPKIRPQGDSQGTTARRKIKILRNNLGLTFILWSAPLMSLIFYFQVYLL